MCAVHPAPARRRSCPARRRPPGRAPRPRTARRRALGRRRRQSPRRGDGRLPPTGGAVNVAMTPGFQQRPDPDGPPARRLTRAHAGLMVWLGRSPVRRAPTSRRRPACDAAARTHPPAKPRGSPSWKSSSTSATSLTERRSWSASLDATCCPTRIGFRSTRAANPRRSPAGAASRTAAPRSPPHSARRDVTRGTLGCPSNSDPLRSGSLLKKQRVHRGARSASPDAAATTE
jgi:hypothetical protein